MSGRSKPPSVYAAFSSAPNPNLGVFSNSNSNLGKNLSYIELHFTHDELQFYLDNRKRNLSQCSYYWIDTAGLLLWQFTEGTINQKKCEAFRCFILTHYQSKCTWDKNLGFFMAFLKYLGKLYMNPLYLSFSLFVEKPHIVKTRMLSNQRHIGVQDLNNLFNQITIHYKSGKLPYANYINYLAFVGFGAYTAQRMWSTMKKVTVGMFREALKDKDCPVMLIPPDMDKIRYEHYCPIHAALVPLLKEAIKGRKSNELMFKYIAFDSWLGRNPVKLTQIKGLFKPSDLRKFGEQYGDEIEWNSVNRAHIMSHDISLISFKHYKSFTPQLVFKIYMRAWKDTNLIPEWGHQEVEYHRKWKWTKGLRQTF